MTSERGDREIIREMLEQYFDGLYRGDINKLERLFHQDTILKAPGLRLSLEAWLHKVAIRTSPAALSQSRCFRVLSIDICGEQAMAKLECPLFDNFYIDFVGFLKEDKRWLIVNKMYANQGDIYALRQH